MGLLQAQSRFILPHRGGIPIPKGEKCVRMALSGWHRKRSGGQGDGSGSWEGEGPVEGAHLPYCSRVQLNIGALRFYVLCMFEVSEIPFYLGSSSNKIHLMIMPYHYSNCSDLNSCQLSPRE